MDEEAWHRVEIKKWPGYETGETCRKVIDEINKGQGEELIKLIKEHMIDEDVK